MFTEMAESGCEEIQCFFDKDSGIRSIIAIHSTALGAAIGGCRMLTYADGYAALEDVIRLSKSMTYKAAMADVPYGGGKSVIIKPKGDIDRKHYFSAFAKFINQLKGRYITAIDSGTTMEDMSIVSEHTPYVTGYNNQAGSTENPSLFTAKGVLSSLLAACFYQYNSTSLTGKKILIKGLGNVGSCLAHLLRERGADLYLTDIDEEKISILSKQIKATPVLLTDMFNQSYDILSPCDTGFTVTSSNIGKIDADIIVGATNNQLETDSLALQLKERNIVYCPDYVVNSGGLIYVTKLYEQKSLENINEHIAKLYDTTLEVLNRADTQNISTKQASDQIANKRLNTNQFETVTSV